MSKAKAGKTGAAVRARLPAFIPAELIEEVPKFKWRIGDGVMHMGPPHTANALYKKLGAAETYCGSLALLAGVYAWGVARFASVRDVTPYLDLHDVMFLLMEPARWLDVSFAELDDWKRDKGHAFDDALGDLKRLALQAIWPGAVLENTGRAPNRFQMVHLVRHLLGPTWRKPFDRWLDAALARCAVADKARGYVARVGHTARARSWGRPLAPVVLVPDGPEGGDARARARFIADVAWKKNRFFDAGVGRFARLPAAKRKALRAIGVASLADVKRVGLEAVAEATDQDGNGVMVEAMLRIELAQRA